MRAPRKLLIAAGLLTLLVVIFLILVLGSTSSHKEPGPQDIAYKPARAPVEIKSTETPVKPLAKEAPPEKPKTTVEKPAFNAAELRRQIDEITAQANLAGIVGTVMLNSGRPQDHEQLQGRIRQFDGAIKDLILRLEENGLLQESPERFQPGDRITSFAGKKVDPARTLAPLVPSGARRKHHGDEKPPAGVVRDGIQGPQSRARGARPPGGHRPRGDPGLCRIERAEAASPGPLPRRPDDRAQTKARGASRILPDLDALR
jgi:hypothetical protein